MDKATLRARCETALQSLPDAAYKTMLAALFDDLLAAQSAPSEQVSAMQEAMNALATVHLDHMGGTHADVERCFAAAKALYPFVFASSQAPAQAVQDAPAVRMLTVPTVEQKQATEALGTLSTISDGDVKECVRVLRQYVEQSSRAARMLKEGEIEDVLRMPVYSPSIIPIYMQMAVELQRKFCAVNAGRTIPADGKIGGAA